MNCPACVSESLVMSERQGIEIDYCSKCRGVWLDRGELDKIIERSVGGEPARDTERDQRGYSGREDSHHGGSYQKKRKGFLSELFD
jgi:uncharacterized protein